MSIVLPVVRPVPASLKAVGAVRPAGNLGHVRGKLTEKGVVGLMSAAMRLCGVLLTWPQHQSLVSAIDQPRTRAVRVAFPRVQYRYTLPYLATSLGWKARRAALKSHYDFVNQVFAADFYSRVLGDKLEIWRHEVGGEALSVSVQGLCPVTRHREGELTLCFKLAGVPIYKLSFSIVCLAGLNLAGVDASGRAAHALYIGRVQGVSGAMDAIRQATTLLGDIAPQDLLMSVLTGLAGALRIDTLIGVSDDTCVSHDTIAQSGSSFCYSDFWARYAGQDLEGGIT